MLDRSVVIERFDEGPSAAARFVHIRAAAAAASPFVQRALALDVAERQAVFEAPAGAPWAEASLPRGPRDVLRLLKRLARGLAALHERGVAHGALGPTTIVVDDGAIPTLLIAGLPPAAEDATASADADVTALLGLVARHLACAPSWAAIAATFMSKVAPPSPHDGAALYVALDEVELAYLLERSTND